MSSSEARRRFAELVGRAHDGGKVTIIERLGTPMVAVIPIEMCEGFVAEREARFEVLDRIRFRVSDCPVEETERDVAAAIEAIRAGRA